MEFKRVKAGGTKRNNLLLKPSKLTSVLTASRSGKGQAMNKMVNYKTFKFIILVFLMVLY